MQLTDFTNDKIFDLNETIAAELFTQTTYAWEVLPLITGFIRKIGPTLPADRFEQRGEDIWVAKSATVFDSAYIGGPCIIDEDATVRQCAFIRGSAIVGKGTTVGNSTELKNVILFNKCEVPHYNYVGDSILGYYSHMGAGSITSNVRSDKQSITVHDRGTDIPTGIRKIGAMVGDHAEIGCNAVLNPGTVVGRNSVVYPLCSVRGTIPQDSICKTTEIIVEKR